MNRWIKSSIIFVAGAVTGALATEIYLGKRYRQSIEDEIERMHIANGEFVIHERALSTEEVQDIISNLDEETIKNLEQSVKDDELPEDIFDDAEDAFFDYTQFDDKDDDYILDDDGSSLDRMYEYEMPIDHEKPYLIPEEEFGDVAYQQYYYIMYADGVVADDMDREVRDVEGMFGVENLSHFGDKYLYPTQNDLLYIRDDQMKWEYEIALDTRKFDTEKYPNSPYRLEE